MMTITDAEKHQLLAVIDSIFYRVGLLKDTKADRALERELAARLASMWNDTCDTLLAQLMDAIPEDYDTLDFEDVVGYIRKMLADALGQPFAQSDKVKATLSAYIRTAYQNGKRGIKAIAPNTPADFAKMNIFDANAVRVLSKHNCYWLGEHYGKDIGPKIAELTAAAVRDGIGRAQLAKELKAALHSEAGEEYKYWDIVSSAALVRSRSFGRISGMTDAGIVEYKILAMGDERTCAICGNMNGRVFSVPAAMRKIKSVLTIDDPEQFKAAMPWGKFDPQSSNAALMAQGRAIPPFHGRCRCVIVAVDVGIDAENKYMTTADPVRDVLGSIKDSHPEEMKRIRKEALELGVEMVQNATSIAYAPGTVPGRPGQIHLSENDSYGAWLHEERHMLDDEKDGWLGLRGLRDVERRCQMEYNAYKCEIDLARELGNKSLEEKLVRLYKDEIHKLGGKPIEFE